VEKNSCILQNHLQTRITNSWGISEPNAIFVRNITRHRTKTFWLNSTQGRVMAQAVSRRPPTAEARVRSRVSPCGICGGQSSTRTGFSPSTSVFPCQFHSTDAPLPGKGQKIIIIFLFITGLHNKPHGCSASVASAAGPFTTIYIHIYINIYKSTQVEGRTATYYTCVFLVFTFIYLVDTYVLRKQKACFPFFSFTRHVLLWHGVRDWGQSFTFTGHNSDCCCRSMCLTYRRHLVRKMK
jgi:hypothetical protein